MGVNNNILYYIDFNFDYKSICIIVSQYQRLLNCLNSTFGCWVIHFFVFGSTLGLLWDHNGITTLLQQDYDGTRTTTKQLRLLQYILHWDYYGTKMGLQQDYDGTVMGPRLQ